MKTKIDVTNYEEIRTLLKSAGVAHAMKLQQLEDEVSACAERCAGLEAKAASLEGEEAGTVFTEWRTANQAKEFAQGRLKAFLRAYPDAASYEGEEFRQQVQVVDEAIARRLHGMTGEVQELLERILKAQTDLNASVEAVEALSDQHAATLHLAAEVRAKLSPEERMALPQVQFHPILAAVGDFSVSLRHGVGGAYLQNNVLSGRRELAEKE